MAKEITIRIPIGKYKNESYFIEKSPLSWDLAIDIKKRNSEVTEKKYFSTIESLVKNGINKYVKDSEAVKNISELFLGFEKRQNDVVNRINKELEERVRELEEENLELQKQLKG
jgi:hypothetical protein